MHLNNPEFLLSSCSDYSSISSVKETVSSFWKFPKIQNEQNSQLKCYSAHTTFLQSKCQRSQVRGDSKEILQRNDEKRMSLVVSVSSSALTRRRPWKIILIKSKNEGKVSKRLKDTELMQRQILRLIFQISPAQYLLSKVANLTNPN